MSLLGHLIAVECDDDMGRHWTTFDARTDDTAAAAYIAALGEAGHLSDVDCQTGCPCLTPTPGCPQCQPEGACWDCRMAYTPTDVPTVGTAQPTGCECGDPWCGDDHRDNSDALREAFAGE